MNTDDKNSFLCGLPLYKIILNFIFIVVFAILNVYILEEFSYLINYISDIHNFVNQIIKLFGLIIVFQLIDLLGSVYLEVIRVELLNATDRYYFKRLYLASPDKIQKYHTGVIVSLITQIKERKSTFFNQLFVGLILGFAQLLFISVVLFRADYRISLLYLLCVTFCIMLNIIMTKVSGKLRIDMVVAIRNKNKLLMDFISGIMTVKKTRSYEFLRDYIRRGNREVRSKSLKSELLRSSYMTLKTLICYLTVILLIYISYKINPSDLNTIIYLASLPSLLQHTIKGITIALFAKADYNTVRDNLFEVITQLDTIERTDKFIKYELLDVKYSYPNSNNQISIDSFSIIKGDKIIITGESGQGKTTLLNILTGFIDIPDCIKMIDGKETNYYIDGAIITQDVELFDISLRDNLTLGKDISDEKLLSMIDAVGLSDWFQSLSKGLDTVLGERGGNLSVGQKQRLLLLRGLLIDKEIYFFDEPTSNLDEETEKKIVKLFSTVLRNKTVIIITHRMSLLELGTKFYTYSNGTLQPSNLK